ncbi:MAG: hypothetical protein ACK4MS_09995 [Paracoccaceae bacterium]
MNRIFSRAFGAMAVLFPTVLFPIDGSAQFCTGWAACPPYAYTLTSASPGRSYGVLVALAQDAPCEVVRFRVRSDDRPNLGTTPPLVPGQLAVLRLGKGFDAGEHALLIESSGCAVHPSQTRRVILNRLGHDHSWRGN